MPEAAAALHSVQHAMYGLIELNHVMAEVYRVAVDVVQSDLYRTIFRYCLQQRELFSTELEVLVLSYADATQSCGYGRGTWHAKWFDKERILQADDAAILSLCARGEDEAVHMYETVLQQKMPGDVRTVLRYQCAEVETAHAYVQRLTMRQNQDV